MASRRIMIFLLATSNIDDKTLKHLCFILMLLGMVAHHHVGIQAQLACWL
jgi:hypothetical protein